MAWVWQEWQRLKYMNGTIDAASDDLLYRKEGSALAALRDQLHAVYCQHVLPLENRTFFHEVYDTPLAEQDFKAAPMVLLIPSQNTNHAELVSQLVGCSLDGADGRQFLGSAGTFTFIFNDEPGAEPEAQQDPSLHRQYTMSLARHHQKQNNPLSNKSRASVKLKSNYDGDEDGDGPVCNVMDGAVLAQKHRHHLVDLRALADAAGAGSSFLTDHVTGLLVKGSYTAARMTVVVAPDLPSSPGMNGANDDNNNNYGDDEDMEGTAELDYWYCGALQFLAARAERILVTLDAGSSPNIVSPKAAVALHALRRWVSRITIDIFFDPNSTKLNRSQKSTGCPSALRHVQKTSQLMWELARVLGTRTRLPRLGANLFRSSTDSAGVTDALFRAGEEALCRDLFYMAQCSVLRRADDLLQRTKLARGLAHFVNAVHADLPSLTLPFKLPESVGIPGLPGLRIPVPNRSEKARQRILGNLELYVTRAKRHCSTSALPVSPDLLRDLLVYKQLEGSSASSPMSLPTVIPEDQLIESEIKANALVNKILARLVQVCNIPTTQYDLRSKVFVGRGHDTYLLADASRRRLLLQQMRFDDLGPDPFDTVPFKGFIEAVVAAGLLTCPALADRVAWLAHCHQPRDDKKLTRREFLTAMHLVLCKRAGLDLPCPSRTSSSWPPASRLPPRLLHPNDRHCHVCQPASSRALDPSRCHLTLGDSRSRATSSMLVMGSPASAAVTSASEEYRTKLCRAFDERRKFHKASGLVDMQQDELDYILCHDDSPTAAASTAGMSKTSPRVIDGRSSRLMNDSAVHNDDDDAAGVADEMIRHASGRFSVQDNESRESKSRVRHRSRHQSSAAPISRHQKQQQQQQQDTESDTKIIKRREDNWRGEEDSVTAIEPTSTSNNHKDNIDDDDDGVNKRQIQRRLKEKQSLKLRNNKAAIPINRLSGSKRREDNLREEDEEDSMTVITEPTINSINYRSNHPDIAVVDKDANTRRCRQQ
ncbi:unnamed protein product [Notodromas monacha]|uniref:Uncharacterized protein n=1 Tax=Notodromas monacha TaxID=399045 RepID=A0A7R9BSQ2_9CRUS|nr:unnamed protein product [Notodromas monacha]CAG0920707.1 unnamed protein product [Notodromas monacha]